MAIFRWGVFGTGQISAKFTAGLAAAPGHHVAMVASRSQASADRFAAEFGISRAIAGYSAAAAAGGIDAAYIATPVSTHAEIALACIANGLAVLIEKPIASSANEARSIANAAEVAGVFAMEAMWTRFLPASQAFRETLANGTIGERRIVTGAFGTSKIPDLADSSFDPVRAGGAAAMAFYPISLADWLFGPPSQIVAVGHHGDTGVEEDVAVSISYSGGVIGQFTGSLRAWSANDFQVMGSHGRLAFRGPVFRPSGYELVREAPRGIGHARFDWKARLREHGLIQRVAQVTGRSSRARGRIFAVPYAGNGYHYEALEVATCLAHGMRESPIMPLSSSVRVASILDTIRSAINGN